MVDKAPILPLAVSMITGILLADILNSIQFFSILPAGWPTELLLLAVCTAITWFLLPWRRCQTVALWFCAMLAGATLTDYHQRQLDISWPDAPLTDEVVVMNEPVVKGKWVVTDVLTANGQKLRLRIEQDEDSRQLTVGDGLQIYTIINKVREWHQDTFDYRRYMQCHGFAGEAFVHQDQWLPHEVSLDGWTVFDRLRLQFLMFRHQLLAQYRLWGVDHTAYGIIAAMTLGDKSALDSRTKDVFAQVGASHILALSGLHLMIIYGVLSLLVSWRRLRLWSQVIIVLSIWSFALLTGLSPSVLRAASMISIYALLSLGYRSKMSVNTLAFVAILMLLVNPLSLYDIGFQLSFLAVLAIVLFNPLLRALIPLHILQRHRWLDAAWSLTTVSVAAQIGTAPLIAYYFGRLPVLFLLSNFIVIPLSYLILHLTLLMVALCWWSWAVSLTAQLLSVLVGVMNMLLTWVSTLPACSIGGLYPSVLQVFLLYVLIGCGYVLLNQRCRARLQSV